MSAFEGYMTFGGVELLNNPRVRGIAESAQPCPMYWLRGPECDTLADALGQVGDYNWNRADRAPWYDPDLPDVSSRFFGIYAYSIGGIYDSTRRADVTESTLDGGVIGATRKGSKRVTVRAIVMARGRDALEYGMTWLNGTLDPDGCGKLGGNCETADIEFLVDCPPPRPNEWIYGAWSTIWTNLATNPSFETASGTTEVRRNLIQNPTGPVAPVGWASAIRWFGSGNSGASTHVTGATDGPEGLTRYYRKTWSAVGVLNDVGFQFSNSGRVAVTPGQVYSLSLWWRNSGGWNVSANAVRAIFWDAATGGTQVGLPLDGPTFSSPPANTWQRVSGTITVPAGATYMDPFFYVSTAASSTIGMTLDGTGFISEASPVVGTYFDGATQPKVRRNLATNPRPTSGWVVNAGAGGVAANTYLTTGAAVGTSEFVRATWTTGSTDVYRGQQATAAAALPVGPISISVWARVNSAQRLTLNYAGTATLTGVVAPNFDLVANVWTKLTLTGTVTVAGIMELRVYANTGGSGRVWAAGNTLDASALLVEASATLGDFFDGSTGAPAGFTAAWEGTANASASYLYDSDFTTAWTGTANASASVLTAPGVAAVNYTVAVANGQQVSYQTAQNPWLGAKAMRVRITTLTGSSIPVLFVDPTNASTYTLLLRARASRALTVTPRIGGTTGTPVALPAGAWTEVRATIVSGSSGSQMTGLLLPSGAGQQYGDTIDIDGAVLIAGSYDGSYFDGSTPSPADDGSHGPLPVIQNIWTGAANASTSQQQLRSATLTPVSDVTYAPLVDESRRFLKGGSVISGPFITDTKSKGEFWAHWVEFTFAVEKPWVYQKTTPLTLTPSLPTVVQDVPYNLAPYPSAELASGTVIVAENLSTNPSVETNATGWVASGSAVSGAAPTIAGARSTELAASGLASFLATATGTGVAVHDVIDYQDVTVAPVTGSRYSLTLWGAMLFTGTGGSGVSLGAKVEWRNSGGTVLRTDSMGSITSAFAGNVFALKSVAPPAGTVTARVILVGRANFTAATVAKVFADALAVSIP